MGGQTNTHKNRHTHTDISLGTNSVRVFVVKIVRPNLEMITNIIAIGSLINKSMLLLVQTVDLLLLLQRAWESQLLFF